MCGRFSDTNKTEKLSKKLKVKRVPKTRPRFNVAPSQPVRAQVGENVEIFNWGLVPSWAKDPTIGQRMINARAETIAEKPSFRGPFKNSRCLVIADGFYEWQKTSTGKVPHYIRLKDEEEVLTFAGLHSHWTSPDGSEILSCTIITTEANDFMKPIHHRMPVILTGESRDLWLDVTATPKELQPLLSPYDSEGLLAYPVSTFVNSPSNDSEECVRSVA